MRLLTLLLLSLMLSFAAWTAWASPHRYAAQDRQHIAETSSKEYPAGTDELGRDRAERLAVAVLLSLGGASLASAFASAASAGLGLLGNLGPGGCRFILLYTADLLLTLPSLFLLMLVRASLPLQAGPISSGAVTFLLLAFLSVPVFLRVNQQSSASVLQANWYLQARASGLRWHQLARHLLPHLQQMFWAQFLLLVPACLLAEANLGTLGLGLVQPLPSLGNFLAALQTDVLLTPSPLTYLPVLVLVAILVTVELAIFGDQQ